MKTPLLFTAASLLFAPLALADSSKKVPDGKKGDDVTIFNGKDLKGWTQRNGTATYVVKDGAIVGTTAEGSPNSFLTTVKEYGDFILEFDVKVDDALNSGVQIRSKTTDGTAHSRVNGPQIEIEASGKNGAEAGYIYGEAIGGWLTPEEDRKPHHHFKDGQWNHYTIIAVGPNIKTWVNGELVSDLTDEKTYQSHPKGFIGLQVHGIKKGTGPYQVAWKNLELTELFPR